MGACATKPKADATDAPAPLPEKEVVVKNDQLSVGGTVIETKEVVDVGVVAAEPTEKSRSLSNLLKENGEVKTSTENDKTQPELVKEEACEAEKNADSSETKTTEIVKSEILVETIKTPTVNAAVEVEAEATENIETPVEKAIPIVDAPARVETEESIEFEPATEKTETLEEKDAPTRVETEESIEVEPATETTETLEEKASTPIICAPVEDEADKGIEVASATEIQKTEAVEGKRIEEHDKTVETPISGSIEVESAGGKTEVVEEKTSTPVEVETYKEIEVASAIEIQKTEAVEETQIEKEKPVTETQKALEEKTTESEVCAENVKP